MAVVPINYLHLRNDDLHETGKTLGRGAYGEVVEVVYLGTPCAAKRIHPILEESGGRLEEGFRRECETWSRLRHPNVVQLLGLLYKPSASSKLPMIVMEKMDCSLRQFVETNKRETIPLYVKADILHQVAQGLVYLHGQRPPVVHRDLSPNNILINLGSMTAKLSDFGVAKLQIHQASRMTSLPGTPTFMPPETLPGAQPPAKGYNDRIDVFSYGGVVICTVTHEWPEPLPPVAKKGGKLVALNEIERRQRYLDLFTAEEKTCFLGLVELCLEYDPVDRPTSQEMMATLQKVKVAHPSQSYVHLLKNLETVTESNRETAKLLQKKTEDMENLQRESSGMQERIKMLQDENSRLSSECDAALANLRESEENVFDLQQTIESLQSQIEEQEGMLSSVKKEQRLEHTLKEPPRQCPVSRAPSQKYHQQPQPMLQYPTMFHPQMVLGAGAPPRQQVVMFPHQQFPPPAHVPAMAYGGARHDLPAAQAPNQKYHQQPQQPSTQLQLKAQSTTKRATKALLLVDPDTNKPLDLVGVSGSSKSKSPEPASVTSPIQDAKRVEFMEKISRTSAITNASAPEPSPSTQQGEAAQQLSEGTSAITDLEQLQELPTQQCLTDHLYPKGSAIAMASNMHKEDKNTSRTETETCSADHENETMRRNVYRYSREQLLSFRFLRECLECPEGLFFPGAIGLVSRTSPMVGEGTGRRRQ